MWHTLVRQDIDGEAVVLLPLPQGGDLHLVQNYRHLGGEVDTSRTLGREVAYRATSASAACGALIFGRWILTRLR